MTPRAPALATLAAALALLAPAATPGQAADPRTSLPDIEDEVMCPVCGTTLELAGAPQAEREREQIRRLIDRGLTKEEVKDELVAEYGEEVLASPASEGFDLAAWVLPGLGLAAAAGAIGVGLTRARRRPGPEQIDEQIDPGESARLDRDLSSYDL